MSDTSRAVWLHRFIDCTPFGAYAPAEAISLAHRTVDQLVGELAEKNSALALAGSELNDLRLDADGLRRDLEKAEAALREMRTRALEDAAEFCDDRASHSSVAMFCVAMCLAATGIRALKNAAPQEIKTVVQSAVALDASASEGLVPAEAAPGMGTDKDLLTVEQIEYAREQLLRPGWSPIKDEDWNKLCDMAQAGLAAAKGEP